jgi:hypothetical protein
MAAMIAGVHPEVQKCASFGAGVLLVLMLPHFSCEASRALVPRVGILDGCTAHLR